MPAVSVVIPVRDGAAFVATAIASVLNQTVTDLELIVVDDGSVDETASVVRKFTDPRLRLIVQPNAGPSAARNAGIAMSTAKWIGFLDADDWWRPGKLAAHLACAARRPDVGLIHSSVEVFNPQGESIEILPATADGSTLERLLFGNIIVGGGSSVTLRRDVIERVGPFDPKVLYGEDWEMWLRVADAYPFAALPEPLTCRVHRPNGYGGDAVAMRDACVLFLTAAFDSYAARFRSHRQKALAEIYYRAATALHENNVRSAACYDLVRTLFRNPWHRYAYGRLVRLAVAT